MTKEEVFHTRYGEMIDLLNCLSIYNGSAEPKTKRQMDYDEVMAMYK